MMVLEWIRRRVPKFDTELRSYLFTQGAITEVEAKVNGGGGAASSDVDERREAEASGSLGIGSLRGGA
jgi:hypothetical protein